MEISPTAGGVRGWWISAIVLFPKSDCKHQRKVGTANFSMNGSYI